MKAEVFSNRFWIEETDPMKIKTVLDVVLNGFFKVLGFQQHFFPVQGWTATWLLGESHCAVHTFPEENASYIDLTSCNDASQRLAMTHIRKYLTIVKIEYDRRIEPCEAPIDKNTYAIRGNNFYVNDNYVGIIEELRGRSQDNTVFVSVSIEAFGRKLRNDYTIDKENIIK